MKRLGGKGITSGREQRFAAALLLMYAYLFLLHINTDLWFKLLIVYFPCILLVLASVLPARIRGEKTELNIALGLCVGHDSMFYKYSEAPVTTLSAKDRLLCHASLGPLYLLDGYWKRLLKPDPYLTAPQSKTEE